MTGIRVPFSVEDVAQARAFVDAIKAVKPNIRRSMLNAEERDGNELAGKLAEVAFAQHFGWAVDWEVHPGGDSRVDFTITNGDTVDVKG